MEFDIHAKVLLSAFLLAVVAGAVMARTNFCTMGAVADWVTMGSLGRMRAWLLAVAVAIGGLLVLELAGLVTLPATTQPPYRTPQFGWLRYVVGGLLFGVGMALGGGCGTKTLLRIGGGSARALFVALLIAGVAYAMFTTRLFEIAVSSWLEPTVIDLTRWGIAGQHLDALIAHGLGTSPGATRTVVALLIVAGLLWFVLRSPQFRRNRNLWLGGIVVGAAVALGWYITGGPHSADWKDAAMFAADRPSRVEVQTLTFISPIGDTLRYLLDPTRMSLLNFGVMTVFGVVVGSFLYMLAARRLRFEWFVSWRDFASHLAGGLLMGFGGFVAMGCTIGQGVSGVSTLALGSLIALASMIAGAAATIRLQYLLSD